MKQKILLAALSLLLTTAHAQNHLNFVLKDGSTKQFDLLNRKITFDTSGNMLLWFERSVQESIPFANLRKLVFTDTPSSISSVDDSPSVRLLVENDYLYVVGLECDAVQPIAIHSLTGGASLMIRQSLNDPIGVHSLPKGVYLLQTAQQSFKFIRP